MHSTATEVEFFHADATLNAKFGDGTEIGTITGSIDNIEAGGESVTGSIELVVNDPGAANPSPNIVDAGTFTGRARMHDTGVDDASGEGRLPVHRDLGRHLLQPHGERRGDRRHR